MSVLIIVSSVCSARFPLQLGHPCHQHGAGQHLRLDVHLPLQELRGASAVAKKQSRLRGGVRKHSAMTQHRIVSRPSPRQTSPALRLEEPTC